MKKRLKLREWVKVVILGISMITFFEVLPYICEYIIAPLLSNFVQEES